MLSGSEVEQLLLASANLKHRAMFTLLYGAGLRVAELTALSAADIEVRPVRTSNNIAGSSGAASASFPCRTSTSFSRCLRSFVPS